ncbi:MAG: cupin domain-containing protein [FCB group bacterium]|nr:cupin domain-containing protein [FCB group bacterium]
MFIKHIDEIEKIDVSGGEIKNVIKQAPIGPEQGWENHILRVFTLGVDGHTPKHSHDWEHVNYVISGTGQVEIDGRAHQLTTGSFAVVPPNARHQYSNGGKEDFVMICIVPAHGDY